MKTDSRFPRLRAVVRTFTSPRRVWFWTTTLPVLLAPVALYLVMRPGVEFEHRVQVGAVGAFVGRGETLEGERQGAAFLGYSGVSAMVECSVPVAGQPVYRVHPAIHRLGPLIWVWEPRSKTFGIDAHRFGIWVLIEH